jgi:CheY-like chemotaxis protein
MDMTHSKSRLLLVDGDPKSLRVLDVSLKKAGFDVVAATSGSEALAVLEAGRPDLIISDTDLDEMDGFELCSRIKARPEWAKIPFLFVSGRKSIEDKIRGLELGVDDYLTKPIYIKEIGIRVRTALQRAERERMESRREGRTRFAGDLSDVGVVDLVQTIELNRKSGIIHIVNRDGRRGSIFFRDGKVIDAEVGRLSGANAMYRLFSWSEGQFAVEFKQIRRHDVIDTPIAPLLMEGMRRLDESAHLLEKLPPLTAVLEVDCRALAEELAELPDEMNSVLRLCDGTRTLQEVVEDSEHPDLEALSIISKLSVAEIVFARDASDRGGDAEPSERLAHWLSEGASEDGASAEESTEATPPGPLATSRLDSDLIPDSTPSPDHGKAEHTATVDLEPAFTPNLVGTSAGANLPCADPESASPVELLSAEESLSAALPERPDLPDKTADFSISGGTLKGIPIGNLFQATDGTSDPPPAAPSAVAEPGAVEAPLDARSTKSLGLAERLLSEDSVVRVSAMHEAIAEDDGRVQGPIANGRQTREYGDPEALAAAALVDEVVSSSHEARSDEPPPAKPERLSNEVDWGAWPTVSAPAPEAPASALTALAGRSGEHHPSQRESEVAATPATREAEPSSSPAGATSSPPPSLAPEPPEPATETASAPFTPKEATPAPSLRIASAVSDGAEATGEVSSGLAGRKLGLVVAAALLFGAISYLAWGRKPRPAPSPIVPSASQVVATPTPSAAPAPAELPAKPPASDAKHAEGKGHPPLLGGSLTSELRRKCLATDDDGKGKAKAVAIACRPALDAEPNDVNLMGILARAEIDRGHLMEAKSLAKKMLAADPQRFDAYVFLGTAEQEAGKTDEARAAYKKYLELAPDGPFARELRAILSNL